MTLDTTLLSGVMGIQLTAKDIVGVLKDNYSGERYVFFEELRIGTGYGDENEKRLDAWCIDLYPSSRLEHIAFEIKVSRSDFKAELKESRKRRYALLYSNRFYFVAPKGLIDPNELPPECGLIEIIDARGMNGKQCHTRVLAPWRDGFAPTWNFVAAISRRIKRISP